MCVTCRQLSEAQVLHGACGDERFLGVVQDVSECVHANVEVGDVDAHGLFSHGGLIRVPGRLNKETVCNHRDNISGFHAPVSPSSAAGKVPDCGQGRG